LAGQFSGNFSFEFPDHEIPLLLDLVLDLKNPLALAALFPAG